MTEDQKVNDIDVQALKQVMAEITENASKGKVTFQVTSSWTRQTTMETKVDSYTLGGTTIPRGYSITIDEPTELLGSNSAPNPQEMLMAAFNSCMMVGYVVGASVRGIKLEKLEIYTEGTLDLRGFLGLDANVSPGYDEMQYTVRVKGNGTAEQLREIHETVIATSPNRWNLAKPVRLDAQLIIE